MDRKDFEALLNNYPDCVSDGKKLKAFLKDLYPDVPKAIVSTLTIMADDGIIAEIQKVGQTPLVSARLQKKLEDDYGLSQKIISDCFSLIIHENAKQTQTTHSINSNDEINVISDDQFKSVPIKEEVLQHFTSDLACVPNDFLIRDGSLVRYNGTKSNVIIPDGVTSIGDSAFLGQKNRIISVKIPDSVISIGQYTFMNCFKLIEIYNKSSVRTKTIKNLAPYVKNVYAKEGESKVSTDENGFVIYKEGKGKILVDYQGNETNITLPSDITEINQYAFYKNAKLSCITIPNGMTKIGYCAFADCVCLASIIIPNSVTSIGGYAFSGTKWYESQPDGIVYAGKVAYKYKCENKFAMPENIDIALKEGTLGIAGMAFSGLKGLSKIIIPDSVTNIGSEAFHFCTGLSSLIISKGVTKIGNYAFSECKGLTSVTIGDNVKSIGAFAFIDCISVNSINGSSYGTSIVAEQCGSKSYEVCITKAADIGPFAFFGLEGLKHITIQDGVKQIGSHAFTNCNWLTDVTIPDSVISIGECAFSGCESLSYFRIGNNVANIGRSGFSDCSDLISISIPRSVTSIGDDTFSNCDNLTIYCETEKLPKSWTNVNWNPDNRPVVWGVKNKT